MKSLSRENQADIIEAFRVADGPITARCRFLKNASWDPATFRHMNT